MTRLIGRSFVNLMYARVSALNFPRNTILAVTTFAPPICLIYSVKRIKKNVFPELHFMYLKSLFIGVIATCERTGLLLKHPEREKRHSDI